MSRTSPTCTLYGGNWILLAGCWSGTGGADGRLTVTVEQAPSRIAISPTATALMFPAEKMCTGAMLQPRVMPNPASVAAQSGIRTTRRNLCGEERAVTFDRAKKKHKKQMRSPHCRAAAAV